MLTVSASSSHRSDLVQKRNARDKASTRAVTTTMATVVTRLNGGPSGSAEPEPPVGPGTVADGRVDDELSMAEVAIGPTSSASRSGSGGAVTPPLPTTEADDGATSMGGMVPSSADGVGPHTRPRTRGYPWTRDLLGGNVPPRRAEPVAECIRLVNSSFGNWAGGE